MKRLFYANFARLFNNWVFWINSGILLVYAAVYMLNGCRQERSGLVGVHVLEDYYFQFAMFIGLFSGVFTTLYLSVEYSDGVLKNKIIAGHTREEIYLSNLFFTFFVSLFMACMGCLGGLVGIPTFGTFGMGGFPALCNLLIMVMFLFAFSAVFTMVAMLSPNKAVGAVVTILAFFLMLFAASIMSNRLGEPEMVSDTLITENGITFSDPKPNPRYVDGMAREVLDFAVDLLPAGQGMRLAMGEAKNPVRMLLSSVFVSGFVTWGGIFLFRRKNLK